MHSLDLGLYSHQKELERGEREVGGRGEKGGVKLELESKGKSPLAEAQRRVDHMTHHAGQQATQQHTTEQDSNTLPSRTATHYRAGQQHTTEQDSNTQPSWTATHYRAGQQHTTD